MTRPNSAMYVSAKNFAFSNIKQAYHSHFGDVNRRQSPYFRRIRKKTLFPSVFFIKMADEEGFEPPIRVTPYTRFRVARIQPLCHSSFLKQNQFFNKSNRTNLQALFYQISLLHKLNTIKCRFIIFRNNFYSGNISCSFIYNQTQFHLKQSI